MRLDITKLVLMSALFVGTTTACGKDEGETDTNTGTDDEVCDDGEDNDGDGDEDCDDSDCDGDADCAATEEFDCDNGDDDDNDGATDCDDSDCASDNDCQPEYFTPTYFWIEGGFAYDAANGKIASAILDGTAIAPYVVYSFGTDEYTADFADEFKCDIVFAYEGATPLELEIMVDEDGVTNGGFKADLSDPAWVASTDCLESEGKQLDPDVIADSDGVAWITGGGTVMGLGVGIPSDQIASDIIEYIPEESVPLYGGGGFYLGNADEGAYYAYNVATGYEVDADMNFVGDGSADLLASEFADASGVPAHGFYQVSAFYLFNLQ